MMVVEMGCLKNSTIYQVSCKKLDGRVADRAPTRNDDRMKAIIQIIHFLLLSSCEYHRFYLCRVKTYHSSRNRSIPR